MKFKFALMLALQLPASAPYAAAPPASGSAPQAAAQEVFVVAPADLPAQAQGVPIDTPKLTEPQARAGKPVSAAQVWSGPVPLPLPLWILLASMPVIAIAYFAYQLLLFIQARRRRLSHTHSQK
ncbi:MAG: hypothetical protein HYZ65_15470 [Burkholderiales bacterium]|nr:hypothetical protein [Burkholderiales bacterium]